MGALVPPGPPQRLRSRIFLVLAVLVAASWSLVIVLICISPTPRDAGCRFMCVLAMRLALLERRLLRQTHV